MQFKHAPNAPFATVARHARLAGLRIGIALFCCAHGIIHGQEAGVELVRNGQARARIAIAGEADGQERAAARTLSEFIAQATGADIPLVTNAAAAPFDGATIKVGQKFLADTAALLPAGFDGDGFVIAVRPPRSITIAGPTAWGTEFGIYEFLERYLGVRWLMPGAHGTDVPRRDSLVIPGGAVMDQPVFFSRHMNPKRDRRKGQGGWNREQADWLRFNRVHSRISFSHNLYQVLPMEKYAAAHPEFYPVLNGKRQTTPPYPPHAEPGWQPCFSATGSVDEAVKNISEYFDKNPDATSYSLGVNDRGGFCQCEKCLARVPRENSRFDLYADYSDLYHAWAGLVIDGVLQRHPGKWFGAIAYREVTNPPKHVKVHPRLVMFDCHERMFWVKPDFAEADKAMARAWAKASENFGWYDYIYGSFYQLPRVYPRLAGEYLRFAADAGVKAHCAEAFPNWGEGPKLYVHLKLWWNPRQDVDKLLSEWYARAVGPKAAPCLAQYYDLWEKFWTRDILKSGWFPLRPRIYMAFNHPGYLEDVNPEYIVRSRELLGQVMQLVETREQAARAAMIMRAFEFYEASTAAFQQHRKILKADPPASEAEALAILEDAVRARAAAEQRNRLALAIAAEDPHLVDQRAIEGSLSGDTWGLAGIEAVADWVARSNAAVTRRMQELAEHGECVKLRSAARKALEAPPPVAANFPDGAWRFCKDPGGIGLSLGWYGKDFDDQDWLTIKVPAFWSATWVGDYQGYGWYRADFKTPADIEERNLAVKFEGVDEQAWVFVNGRLLKEHTLVSEQQGYSIWNKPFTVEIAKPHLNPPGASNLIAVLVHSYALEGGIWGAVRIPDNGVESKPLAAERPALEPADD